jgi:hypothetical protein
LQVIVAGTGTYILLGVFFFDAGALRRDELVTSLVDNTDANLTLVALKTTTKKFALHSIFNNDLWVFEKSF